MIQSAALFALTCVRCRWRKGFNYLNKLITDFDFVHFQSWKISTKANLPPISLPNTNNCPDGWISWGVACYQLFTEMVSFPEAKQKCEAMKFDKGKAFLTSIMNEYENRNVLHSNINFEVLLKFQKTFSVSYSHSLVLMPLTEFHRLRFGLD